VRALRQSRKHMSDLYYIQNKKGAGCVGNCTLFWCVDGSGYTVDLDKAWKVSKEQGESICRSRRPTEDYLHSVDRIDAIAHRHVDIQLVMDMGRAAQSANAEKPQPTNESR
jgi:hypothetical protein